MSPTALTVDDEPRFRRRRSGGLRAAPLLAWAAGAALTIAVLVGGTHTATLPQERVWITYGVALLVITLGAAAWELRPDTRTGGLLAGLAAAGVLGDLDLVFPESSAAVTVGLGATLLAAPLFVHLVLSYATGRLASRLDRGFVQLGYGFAVVYALPLLLFYSPRAPFDPDIWACPSCALPLTHVAWYEVSRVKDVLDGILFALALVFLALVLRELRRSTRGGRRVVLPLAVAGLFAAAQLAVQIAVFGEPVNSWWANSGWFWVVTSAVLVVPVALVVGLLWGRAARSAVADLVVELERAPTASVRDALAHTLGDPSLVLALWLPDRGCYVDAEGKAVQLPENDPQRGVTLLGSDAAPVAALVHDRALLEQRAFLNAAGAAARFALENERLQAELRLQLQEVRASRARIVQAGDDERRRLERNLHDGAQQRLLALGLAVQLARAKLGPTADGAAALLDEAEEELRAALDELRELAHGIHPAILDQGLGPALRSLAERAPVPVRLVAVPGERLGGAVEAAAYFVVSEALANVVKHAHASSIRVSITRRNGHAVLDIEDDGVGGADPSRGSGLRGLLDRVQALGGALELDSAPGRGTRIHAEIPCA